MANVIRVYTPARRRIQSYAQVGRECERNQGQEHQRRYDVGACVEHALRQQQFGGVAMTQSHDFSGGIKRRFAYDHADKNGHNQHYGRINQLLDQIVVVESHCIKSLADHFHDPHGEAVARHERRVCGLRNGLSAV